MQITTFKKCMDQKIPSLISCYKSGDVGEINNEKVITRLIGVNSGSMGVGRR